MYYLWTSCWVNWGVGTWAEKKIRLECLIETAEAMEYVREITLSTPRLEAIIFGVADYSASLGVPVTSLARIDEDLPYPGHRWNFALSRMAIAARTAGIQIIDGPFPGLKGEDLITYQRQAESSVALGFDGKWAIHPAQVPVAMKTFTPSDAVIAKRPQKLPSNTRKGKRRDRGPHGRWGDDMTPPPIRLP